MTSPASSGNTCAYEWRPAGERDNPRELVDFPHTLNAAGEVIPLNVERGWFRGFGAALLRVCHRFGWCGRWNAAVDGGSPSLVRAVAVDIATGGYILGIREQAIAGLLIRLFAEQLPDGEEWDGRPVPPVLAEGRRRANCYLSRQGGATGTRRSGYAS